MVLQPMVLPAKRMGQSGVGAAAMGIIWMVVNAKRTSAHATTGRLQQESRAVHMAAVVAWHAVQGIASRVPRVSPTSADAIMVQQPQGRSV